ncbi:MAG: ATPase [Flavobacteriales bacterium]|nr:hypothetical protein [Flavobacteriales bacterium]MCB9447024.1 ATPase [Flavobacteriales bacterium]
MFRLKEKTRLFIYDRQETVMKVFSVVSFVMALLSIGLLLYFDGFDLSPGMRTLVLGTIKTILAYFVLVFCLRWFFSIDRLTFLRRNWFEAFLMLLLVVDGFSVYILQRPMMESLFHSLGIRNFTPVYLLFIQCYIVVFAGLEIIRSNVDIGMVRIKPSLGLALSIGIITLVGAGLLMMPQMTTGRNATFLEALFTSISAVSGTGLIVVDTATFFTTKGHFVIMVLIQVGSLGLVSFSTFFLTYLAQGLSLRHQHQVSEFFTTDSKFRTEELVRQIIFYTVFIDVLGAIVIFFLWDPAVPFKNLGDKMFVSMFHSVSAFCSAGFSTFSNGMYTESIRHSYLLHVAVFLLIFVGSLGYPTLHDMFGIRNVRDRLQFAWRKLRLDSQVSLYTTLFLVFFGAIMFYLLEAKGTLRGMDGGAAVITSLFQSIQRTAGFNTVDIGALNSGTLIVICFLMFVGGSSGSVCGGIRTSTFAIMCISAWNAVRGKNVMTIGHRQISSDMYNRVISIFFFAISLCLFSTFLLTITEPGITFKALIFETISAFGTAGLTTGITSSISDPGRWILVFTMYAGRVGTLTLVLALSAQNAKHHVKYPTAHIMVG